METDSKKHWLLARASGLKHRVGPNVVFLGVVSFLNDTSSEMIYPLLPIFLTTVLGVNMAFLGLIEGAAESVNSLFKLAAGRLSDRFGRRKPLILGGYSLAALSRPFLALSTAGWHVLALRLGDRVGKGMRTAPRDALIAESVRREDFGVAFGFHRAMDHAGAVAGPLLALGLIALLGENLRLIFLLAALPGLATVIVIALRVRDITSEVHPSARPEFSADDDQVRGEKPPSGNTQDEGHPPHGHAPATPSSYSSPPHSQPTSSQDAVHGGARTNGRLNMGLGEDSRQRLQLRGPFGTYLVAVALFSLGNSTDAFLLVRLRDLGVPVALLPAVWVLLHVVKSLSSIPGGYLADRLGRRKVLLAGWAAYAVTYLGFAAASTTGVAVALFAFYGVYFGLAEGTEKALVAQLAPTARGTAYGFYHLAVGVTALPASIVFGIVWERWGAEASFSMGAVLAVAAGLVLLGVREAGPARGPTSPAN
jgi:MFS family permease